MELLINGRSVAAAEGILLLDYLREQAIEPDHVVVELNRDIIERPRFAEVVLNDGDQIEILRFVGGG